MEKGCGQPPPLAEEWSKKPYALPREVPQAPDLKAPYIRTLPLVIEYRYLEPKKQEPSLIAVGICVWWIVKIASAPSTGG